jgi:hypothetical protein
MPPLRALSQRISRRNGGLLKIGSSERFDATSWSYSRPFVEVALDPTQSLQDSVRLLLDVRSLGLPAVLQDLWKLLSRLLNIS